MDTVDERTFGEKVSDTIAKFGGSWKFIFFGAASITAWVALNTLAFFDVVAWDKYPFILLNLFLSLVAAFQAPFIMMSQRRCEIKQDMIYRSLFREIKELVEADLELGHDIMQLHKSMAVELGELKKIVQELRDRKEHREQD